MTCDLCTWSDAHSPTLQTKAFNSVADATVKLLLTLQNQHLIFVVQATDHRCHEIWRWHTEDMNHRAQCIQWLGMFLVINCTGSKAFISSRKGACVTTACVCSTPLTQPEVELSTINTQYQALDMRSIDKQCILQQPMEPYRFTCFNYITQRTALTVHMLFLPCIVPVNTSQAQIFCTVDSRCSILGHALNRHSMLCYGARRLTYSQSLKPCSWRCRS